MQRTITVNDTPKEGETLDINTGMFVFSDQKLETSDRVQISREGDIAENITNAVNARPIGCTATSDGTVVTLEGEEITIAYDGTALEISE